MLKHLLTGNETVVRTMGTMQHMILSMSNWFESNDTVVRTMGEMQMCIPSIAGNTWKSKLYQTSLFLFFFMQTCITSLDLDQILPDWNVIDLTKDRVYPDLLSNSIFKISCCVKLFLFVRVGDWCYSKTFLLSCE